MPFLDVAEVLLDPDFCEVLTVTRSMQGAPAGGFTQIAATTTISVTASVQPANSSDLQRMIDAGRNGGGVSLYAYGANAIQTADTFVWQGDEYTVVGTDDWSKFGAGYVRGTAAKSSLP